MVYSFLEYQLASMLKEHENEFHTIRLSLLLSFMHLIIYSIYTA